MRRLAALLLLAGGLAAAPAAEAPRGEGSFGPDPAARQAGGDPERAWHSGLAGDAGRGRLRVPLDAPGEHLSLVLTGTVSAPATRLALVAPDGAGELKLGLRASPGGAWSRYTWRLPPAWRDRPATLVAEDDSATHALGVALVRAGDGTLARDRWRALGATLAAAVLTLAPFLAAFALLRRRFGGDPTLHLSLALVAAGGFALALFHAFVLAPAAGLALLGAGALGAAAAAVRAAREGPAPVLRLLVLGVAAAVALTATLFLYGGTQSPGGVPAGRHDLGLPPDNHIPELFAERVHEARPLRPFLADWLTSDRPPLQTGFLLVSRPLVRHEAGRVAAAITAQLAVYAGLAALLAAAGLGPRVRAAVLLACATSGFFLLNAVYAWPKLLPAGYLLAVAALLLRLAREGRPATRLEAAAIGAGAALALLGHGGSVFGLAGLGLVHLARRAAWRDGRLVLVAGAVALGVQAPWMAYQRLVDPPGDRLVKYHLAGRTAIDPRGSLTVIAEAYRQTPAERVRANKASNVRVLAGDFTRLLPSLVRTAREAAAGEGRAAYWRFANAVQGGAFFHLLQSLGLLAVGLPALGLARGTPEGRLGLHALAVAGAAVAVWCALMFGPEGTIVHQGSYLVNVLLHVAGVLGLLALPRALGLTLLGLHVALFVGVWVLSPSWSAWQQVLRPGIDGFWGVALVAAAAGLVAAARFRPAGGAGSADRPA